MPPNQSNHQDNFEEANKNDEAMREEFEEIVDLVAERDILTELGARLKERNDQMELNNKNIASLIEIKKEIKKEIGSNCG